MALRRVSRVARGVPARDGARARRRSSGCGRASLRGARRIVVPSRYLAKIARGWGLDAGRIEVLVNPAPPPADVVPARFAPGTFVFVGPPDASRRPCRCCSRRSPQVARREASCSSATAPERPALEAHRRALDGSSERVSFAGALPRRRGARTSRRGACRRAARAPGRTCRTPPSRRSPSARPSSRPPSAASRKWCATARTACSCRRTTRGPRRRDALHPRRRRTQRHGSLPRRSRRSQPIGRDADLRAARADPRRGRRVTLRVLFVGRGRLTLPLAPWLQRKWDALSEVLDLRVLNAGAGNGDSRFALLPDRAAAFYPRLPFEVARSLRVFPAQAIIASDPYVGVAARLGRTLARSQARLVVEVHGDPRTFTRAYGSPARQTRLGPSRCSRSFGHPKRRRDACVVCVHVVARRRGDADIRRRRASPRTATWRRSAIRRSCPSPTLAASCSWVRSRRTRTSTALLQPGGASRRGSPTLMLAVVGRGSRHEVIDRLVAELPAQVEHIAELQPD